MTGVPQLAATEPKYMQTMQMRILLFVNSLCLSGKHTHTNLHGGVEVAHLLILAPRRKVLDLPFHFIMYS